MIKSVSPASEFLRAQQTPPAQTGPQGQFGDLLGQRLAFSKHAMTRAEQRGIAIDDTLCAQLSDSVEKAQQKGAKNILAFDATRAFIVNVPNCRVITAMSQEEMKENVFTNIDGAVIL